MHVGNAFIFQNPDGNEGGQALDAGVYDTEYRLADRVEALGFDSLWGVEHHFNGYAMCPDPLKFLTYFAGRTSRVKLGSMVVVSPWHDPIRVAEDSSALDIVSGGRNILGIGRGVSKLEFDGFRLNMADSRQLLIENTEATLMGLEKGYIEYEGEVVHQPKVLIRPGPIRSFKNRLYMSAQSPESFPIMARLGAGLLFIPGNRPFDVLAGELVEYRRLFRETHKREAPPPIFVGWTFVDEDPVRARDFGQEKIFQYSNSAFNHYNTTGEHMKGLKGYESYAKSAEVMKASGISRDELAKKWTQNHIFGTPDQCVEKIIETQKLLGAAAFLGVFNYSGIGEAEASRNQALFAEKVLPRIKAHEPSLDIGVEELSAAAE